MKQGNNGETARNYKEVKTSTNRTRNEQVGGSIPSAGSSMSGLVRFRPTPLTAYAAKQLVQSQRAAQWGPHCVASGDSNPGGHSFVGVVWGASSHNPFQAGTGSRGLRRLHLARFYCSDVLKQHFEIWIAAVRFSPRAFAWARPLSVESSGMNSAQGETMAARCGGHRSRVSARVVSLAATTVVETAPLALRG